MMERITSVLFNAAPNFLALLFRSLSLLFITWALGITETVNSKPLQSHAIHFSSERSQDLVLETGIYIYGLFPLSDCNTSQVPWWICICMPPRTWHSAKKKSWLEGDQEWMEGEGMLSVPEHLQHCSAFLCFNNKDLHFLCISIPSQRMIWILNLLGNFWAICLPSKCCFFHHSLNYLFLRGRTGVYQLEELYLTGSYKRRRSAITSAT